MEKKLILHIDEKITSGTLTRFVEFINELNRNRNIGIVYLCSDGGQTIYTECMLDIIEKNKDILTLIGFGRLFSTAFDLFFSATCKRELDDGTVGMYHQAQISIEYNENKKTVYHEGNAQIEYLTNYCKMKTNQQMEKLNFDKKEVALIKRGQECYFSVYRMKLFLKLSTTCPA